jgi:c-di-GMP-binding flagellar brake protein YcgR
MRARDIRKYPRIDTSNLIICSSLSENETELDHCLARAINVSPVGVKIETFQRTESEIIRLCSVDSDGTLIDIKGRVVHSRKIEDGKYEIGISLVGTEIENTRFALKLISVCCHADPAFVMVKGPESEKRDRRKYSRIDTNTLISYSCLDENGNELDVCMARVLDVSPLGAKIETYREILSEKLHLVCIDVDDDLIDIMGRIVYAHKADDSRYEFGIRFLGTQDENTELSLKLIDACHKIEPSYVIVKKA